MQPWFKATERFDPSAGEQWASYIAWSGLTQLDELVSLDELLCPDAIDGIPDGYWEHRPATERSLFGCIVTSLPFLLSHLVDRGNSNVLALFLDCDEPGLTRAEGFRFEFLGYDLVERGGSISALSNCGGYPDVFANAELSSKGLLVSAKRAREVQALLRQRHPKEAHADCDLWAIYRAV